MPIQFYLFSMCHWLSLSLFFFINHFKIIFFTIKLSKYATQIKKIDTPIFWKILDTNMDFFCIWLKVSNEAFLTRKKIISRLSRYTFFEEDCLKARPYWALHGNMVRVSFPFFWVLCEVCSGTKLLVVII